MADEAGDAVWGGRLLEVALDARGVTAPLPLPPRWGEGIEVAARPDGLAGLGHIDELDWVRHIVQ